MKRFLQILVLISAFVTANGCQVHADPTLSAESCEEKSKIDLMLQEARERFYETINSIRLELDCVRPSDGNFVGLEDKSSLDKISDASNDNMCFPLAISKRLNFLSKEIATRIYTNGLQDVNDEALKDILEAYGYKNDNATMVAAAMIISDYIDPCQAIDTFIRYFLHSGKASGFFDIKYNSFGFYFDKIESFVNNRKPGYVFTAILTHPFVPNDGNLIQCGRIFYDRNGDGRYDREEGFAQVKIEYMPEPGKIEALGQSFASGKYCIERPFDIKNIYLNNMDIVPAYNYDRGVWNKSVYYLDWPLD